MIERRHRARVVPVSALLSVALLIAGCGASGGGAAKAPTGWPQAVAQARGQTVRWWMYGGDAATNAYVDGYIRPAAARLGVHLERVPITETSEAVSRVAAERRAGKQSGGAVDLIWINGSDFAAGKSAGLWLKNWTGHLPNMRFVDSASPIISRDFQVPVEGQESPWEGAAFIYGYNAAQVSSPPTTLPGLLAWARTHHGRFTYPAPPDFTGAAFVRQVIQRLGGERQGLAFLKELRPFQYQHGRVFPQSSDELDQLFANGQVSFDMSYNANFLNLGVRSGKFPSTVRPLLIGGGALENTSYVTIPANASHIAGAEVLANLLLAPPLQADLEKPAILGMPSVLSPQRLPAALAGLLHRSASTSPYILASLGQPLTELPSGEVEPINAAWTREVLR